MVIIGVVYIVIAEFFLLFAAFYAGILFANVKNYFNLKKLKKEADEILDLIAKYQTENEKFDVFDDVGE